MLIKAYSLGDQHGKRRVDGSNPLWRVILFFYSSIKQQKITLFHRLLEDDKRSQKKRLPLLQNQMLIRLSFHKVQTIVCHALTLCNVRR